LCDWNKLIDIEELANGSIVGPGNGCLDCEG
jgi:hypothetical protein